MRALNAVPWFLPGVAVAIVLGVIAATRIAVALRTNRATAIFLVVSIGVIISATLTPLQGVFESGLTGSTRTCDLGRWSLASLERLTHINDTSLNVALFAPLGMAIGLLPLTRRKLAVALAASLLPVAIELLQLLLPILGRGCQSADVIDNLTGLIGGVTVTTVAGLLRAVLRGRSPASRT